MADEIIEGIAVNGSLLSWSVVADTRDRLAILQKLLPRCNVRPDARTLELVRLYDDLLARAETRADASTRVELESMPHDGDGLVDSTTAAEMLGIAEDTVRWHCRRGRFAKVAMRRGGRWWIPVTDVEACASAQRTKDDGHEPD